jgi:hypothetical protein
VEVLEDRNVPAFLAAPLDPVGVNPVAVAVGDFNGDGMLDLVVADDTRPSTVSILLGNGNGSFRVPVHYHVSMYAVSVAVADVNGDGKPDLVTANDSSNNVSVQLGNGNGTFRSAVNYATGKYSVSLVVADVKGDGKPDLAVTQISSLSVLLGKGDGSFRRAITYAVAGSPWAVAVADVNRDRHPDLITTNLASGVSVLLNGPRTPFGGTAAPAPLSGTQPARALAAWQIWATADPSPGAWLARPLLAAATPAMPPAESSPFLVAMPESYRTPLTAAVDRPAMPSPAIDIDLAAFQPGLWSHQLWTDWALARLP